VTPAAEPFPPAGSAASATRWRVLCAIAFCLYIVATGALILLSKGPLDPARAPIGYDFSAYYEAAQFAKSANAAGAYHDAQMIAAEQARFPGAVTRLPWNYPPLFTLLLLPFAYLPYFVAWLLWSVLLFGGYALLVRRLMRAEFFPLLLFPAAALNIFLGANGLLSAVLIGAGVLLLKRRPLAAGLVFALACFKPHLALLIPLILLLAREYKALGAMAAGVGALVLLSMASFGIEPWMAFLAKAAQGTAVAHTSSSDWRQVPTIHTLAQFLGVSPAFAMAAQGLCALSAAGAVAWLWRRCDEPVLRAGALAAGILVVTPYARVYDLALLIFPIASLMAGQRPRATIAMAAWCAPLLALVFGPAMSLFALLPFLLLALLVHGAWRANPHARLVPAPGSPLPA
jgi:hypothetical protein